MVITTGQITCTQAYNTAFAFNTQGQSVQRIGGYTCQLGNATTRPIIFTCTRAHAQFSVQEALGPQGCRTVGRYQIVITTGQITCTQAYNTAFAFNTQGQSVQRIGGYTCQLGNATTRPIIFTCTGPHAQFSVEQP